MLPRDLLRWSLAIIIFEQTPPHAELLGRIAKIVAQTQTAFIAGVGTSCLETKPADLHPLIRQSWDALAKMPEAGYMGLVVPRFMLRAPYGERTDPIESFDFEEFTPQAGLSGMLWGNSAVIAGLLLGATFSQEGAKMKPGSVLTLGEMPFYYYTDAEGEQTALPCTERMLSSKMAEMVSKHHFMPMLSDERQAGSAFGWLWLSRRRSARRPVAACHRVFTFISNARSGSRQPRA